VESNENQMTTSKRGGKRPGAGRPIGAQSRATKEAKGTLTEIAKQHAPDAIATLAAIMRSDKASDSARVAAADKILDRGYGKPPQFTTGDVGAFKRATEMTDDELAAIAAGGSRGTDPAPRGASKPH
jgi:hypothetical protein